MASILFVMRYPLHKGDNLKSKFDGQMAAARALGHQAYFIGWDDRAFWLMGGDEPQRLTGAGLTCAPGYEHTLFFVHLARAVSAAVRLRSFDVVYLRFMSYFGGIVPALCAAKAAGAKLVVEHPTYPFENGKVTSWLRKPVFWYCGRVFARVVPMIDLYALIGEPCGGTLDGRPAVNIQNGVDTSLLPLHAPRADAPDVGILALASMSFWQGYDRLIRSLAEYRGETPVTLYLVGGEGDGSLAQWKRLADTLGLGARVQFYPPTYGAELDALIARCDIGVGQLGLYRKRQSINVPLKLREYMARGLPFLYTPVAPGIPDEPRYCMSLPNDDSPIDMSAVAAFALRAKRDADAPVEMRRYAEEHMSWRTALKRVLSEVGVR